MYHFTFIDKIDGGDRVVDFDRGFDALELEGFGRFQFAKGSSPVGIPDGPWLLCDTDDGKLDCGEDGSGQGLFVLVVTLDGAPDLVEDDLIVI